MRSLPAILLLSAALLAAAGCRREERSYDTPRAESDAAVIVALAPISPGGNSPQTATNPKGREYEQNAYAMSQGKRLFQWFNCSGCHGNGGGGSGPALIDDKWIYGARPDQIYATISQGRPDGMPSFGGHITTQQIWQLVAYVQSMAGQVKASSAPSRNDDQMAALPESRQSRQAAVQTGHR